MNRYEVYHSRRKISGNVQPDFGGEIFCMQLIQSVIVNWRGSNSENSSGSQKIEGTNLLLYRWVELANGL